ncbi:MAG: acyl-CoA synthetase FdrA [Rhodospirillales bacterium]|nr:acyl-CoA synthetase FdrA [Rhodospirillales bacterium]
MPVKSLVLASHYQDSVMLMRLAEAVRNGQGVRNVAAFMGTPANKDLLVSSGLATSEGSAAGADDLIIAVDAATETEAEAALIAARQQMMARRQSTAGTGPAAPRTLDSALRVMPDASLALISVPGAHAKLEAMRALKQGLNVFLFSDNVSVADEIELKTEALKQGLLCMGPDCGTAHVDGVGLGFVNVVPPGRVGLVAASGTGLQAVMCHVAARGEGISHAIGIGGRDLSSPVKGAMTFVALDRLAADPATAAIVIVSKPPDADVLPLLEAKLAAIAKPKVVCCLGALPKATAGAVWVDTLDGAADAVVAVLKGQTWTRRDFADRADVATRLARVGHGAVFAGKAIRGLYTGGTLASEAKLLLKPLIGAVGSDLAASGSSPHRIVDLGDDAYTVGRPHPMIDPAARSIQVVAAGRAPEVGVLLVDLVLGLASHPNPAASLAAAVTTARTAAESEGRKLAVLGSVVGTTLDPQNLAAQTATLEAAGIELFPSNAEAARFAALLVKPDLVTTLFGG